MLYGCLTSSLYTMYADIMELNISQNAETGEVVREWLPSETIACLATAVINESVSDRSSGKAFTEGAGYKEYQVIKLRSAVNISKRLKVTNIRDAKTGEVLWAEEKIAGTPTVYDVQGTLPVTVVGQTLGFETLLRRAEVQVGN